VSGAINSASVEGFLAANGVGLNFNDNCAVENASLTSVDGVFIYINYVETFVQFTNALCYSTSRGKLNHIEVKLSTTSIEVWASDYSPDNVAFPNFRKIGSAAISIPFSSGYVHFQQKERAPIKNEAGFYNPGYANNYTGAISVSMARLLPGRSRIRSPTRSQWTRTRPQIPMPTSPGPSTLGTGCSPRPTACTRVARLAARGPA
jgi:hypothetical protein